jgi:hypothetical protein
MYARARTPLVAEKNWWKAHSIVEEIGFLSLFYVCISMDSYLPEFEYPPPQQSKDDEDLKKGYM